MASVARIADIRGLVSLNDGEEIIQAKVQKRAWLAKNFESELGHC